MRAVNRGIYCLLVTATLLNMITPELIRDLPSFIASCQTYEGGFCNASFPDWALDTVDTGEIRAAGAFLPLFFFPFYSGV